MPERSTGKNAVGLPVRPFLWTLDQIATMISVSTETVKNSYIYYDRVSTGPRPHDKMMARNIAPVGETPQWRVSEQELIRWLRGRGFKIYDRGMVYK